MNLLFSRLLNSICGLLLFLVAVFALLPRWIDDLGAPALLRAASKNEVSHVKWLLGMGVAVDAVDDQNATALHLAARNGNLEVVEILIAAGAATDLRDNQGKAPLHWAVRANQLSVAARLLDKYAKLDADHPRDAALLYLAAGHGNAELTRLLIEAGADVNRTTSRYYRRPIHQAVSSDDLETVELLIEQGAELAVRDAQGRTPLSIAKGRGNTELVACLTTHVGTQMASSAASDVVIRR